MKKFTLYWLTGNSEPVEGNDISDAFTRAGYNGAAGGALDFYSNTHVVEYNWNRKTRSWDKKPEFVVKKPIELVA